MQSSQTTYDVPAADSPAVPPQGGRVGLSDLTPEEIAQALNVKPFQGKQLFRWVHGKRVFDFGAMTDLSKALRTQLSDTATAHRLQLADVSHSERLGTKKVLLRLEDGEAVESVLLRDEDRLTLCISTQVGCAVKCSFCATGMSGYARNLSPGEIVEQALFLLKDEELGERTPNVVLMGMGEPFRNYDATIKAIRLMQHADGLGIGARKVTVSTAGDVPGILKFANEGWQVRLSVSLHAANDELRNVLVPLNRRYPLAKLMDAVHTYAATVGRQVTFEWTLLRDVNDRPQDVEEIVRLTQGLKVFLNLIPYNPVQDLGYQAPNRRTCEAMRDALIEKGIKATLRVERGQDIDAACGQLRRRHLEPNV